MPILYEVPPAKLCPAKVEYLAEAMRRHLTLFAFYARAFHRRGDAHREVPEQRAYERLGLPLTHIVEKRDADELLPHEPQLQTFLDEQRAEPWPDDSGAGDLQAIQEGWRFARCGAESLAASNRETVQLVGALLAEPGRFTQGEEWTLRACAAATTPRTRSNAPRVWAAGVEVYPDCHVTMRSLIGQLEQLRLLESGAERSRDKFQPADYFQTEFGIQASRLRSAKRRGQLRGTEVGRQVRYSIADAERLWPNDMSLRRDKP